MALELTDRHSTPPPKDIHKYLVDPDDTGIYDGVPDNAVEIESGCYPVPLAKYLSRHVKNGDVLVDAGCGKYPISIEMLMQKGEEFKDVRIVALDGRHVGDIKRTVETTIGDTRQCLVVACDLNRLNSEILLRNGRTRPECAERLTSLQEFLTDKGGLDAQADVLFCGNILHSIDLGEPLDFLLSKLRTGGKIVIAGTPDIRWPEDQCPPPGRRMADFRRYLESEGHKVLFHEYCGYVFSPLKLKRIGASVVKPICESTRFGETGAINDEELVDSIISCIIDSSTNGGSVKLGSFGIGGLSRLSSAGYTKLGDTSKGPKSHHVYIPIIFSPDGNLSMFAPQEVIVAEKGESGRRAPAEGGLSAVRERVRRFLFALRGKI